MNDNTAGSPDQEHAAAREILLDIEARGYVALIVGGAVRDHVLGLPMHDIDIATDMPVEEVRAVFRSHDVGKSKDFGINVVLHKGHSFEVAAFRGDTRFDADGRPEGLATSASFREDAGRRDFTLNAMGMDARGALQDPWGGVADLRSGVVRAVGDPGERFDEDPVCLPRAVRFAARFDFELEPATETALRERAAQIRDAAPERIGGELTKMAAQPGTTFAAALRWMDRLGLLEPVLPEVHALKGMPHDVHWHPEGDVFEHTLAACEASRGGDPLVNWAILLHDVGKPHVYQDDHGQPRYLGHEKTGCEWVAAVAKRLRHSTSWIQAVEFGVRHHMKVHRLADMRPSKVFRLVSDEHWELLKEVSRCDQAARGSRADLEAFDRSVRQAEAAARRWRDTLHRTTGQKTLVSGRHVMELTGLSPGPAVGELLRAITDWAIDNGVTDPGTIDAKILELAQTAVHGSQKVRTDE